jgi:hypothetical protein
MRWRRIVVLPERRHRDATAPLGIRRRASACVLVVGLAAACTGAGPSAVSSPSPTGSPTASSTTPASTTSAPSPKPTDSSSVAGEGDRDALLRLIRQDDRILGINAIAGDKFDPDFQSSCTSTSPSAFRQASAVLYFRCPKDDEPFVAAPARVLSDNPGLRDVVNAVLAGPTARERSGGFEPTTIRESNGFQAAVVDGTAVVNFRSPAPIGTNYPEEVSPLVSSLNSLREVTRVSLLVDGTPICEPEGCGPRT